MLSLLTSRLASRKIEAVPAAAALHTIIEQALPEVEESALLRTVGWVSAGLGAVAIGLFVGRELRQRYKFNRRTPYDFYSHAGAEDASDMEFGVGI